MENSELLRKLKEFIDRAVDMSKGPPICPEIIKRVRANPPLSHLPRSAGTLRLKRYNEGKPVLLLENLEHKSEK